jgi:hypothetical protein
MTVSGSVRERVTRGPQYVRVKGRGAYLLGAYLLAGRSSYLLKVVKKEVYNNEVQSMRP